MMAIDALYPMNVVGAGCARVGRVHLLNIETAVGHLRMTRLARGARILIVSGMTGYAT